MRYSRVILSTPVSLTTADGATDVVKVLWCNAPNRAQRVDIWDAANGHDICFRPTGSDAIPGYFPASIVATKYPLTFDDAAADVEKPKPATKK